LFERFAETGGKLREVRSLQMELIEDKFVKAHLVEHMFRID